MTGGAKISRIETQLTRADARRRSAPPGNLQEHRLAISRRLKELDGFRALAILMVIFFHYFHRFDQYYPYGGDLLNISEFGDMGVELFFIVSGFVIAMTLNGTKSLSEFSLKRFSRLWPPMAVCSIMTFAVLHAVDNPFTAAKRPGFDAFVPSWTFTDPKIWQALFPGVRYIDGVYWTLFVEVRFYFWAAILAFTLGKQSFVRNFVVLCAVTGGLSAAAVLSGQNAVYFALNGVFVVEYLHLFCAGVIFHELYEGRREVWKLATLAACMAVTPFVAKTAVDAGLTFAFYALFATLVYRREALGVFRMSGPVWVGCCSYSLYLLHEHVGVTAITSLPVGRSDIFYYAAVLAIGAVMLGISSVVYLAVEKPSSRWMRARLKRGAVPAAKQVG